MCNHCIVHDGSNDSCISRVTATHSVDNNVGEERNVIEGEGAGQV